MFERINKKVKGFFSSQRMKTLALMLLVGTTAGGAVAGFILGYCIFGFVAGLVLLVLAVAVGGVLIVMKQRKGLHSKKSDNGIFIYAYSKKV